MSQTSWRSMRYKRWRARSTAAGPDRYKRKSLLAGDRRIVAAKPSVKRKCLRFDPMNGPGRASGGEMASAGDVYRQERWLIVRCRRSSSPCSLSLPDWPPTRLSFRTRQKKETPLARTSDRSCEGRLASVHRAEGGRKNGGRSAFVVICRGRCCTSGRCPGLQVSGAGAGNRGHWRTPCGPSRRERGLRRRPVAA